MKIIKGSSTRLCSEDDLFNSKYWLDDSTQRVLLPYVRTTQLLLSKAIKLYDHNGSANIIPSFDLGFTYNTARLAGGFTTGMIVNWNSSIPFVPIDMTIKECSGSVISISADSTDFFSLDQIKISLKKMWKKGFRFNFSSGNHFIALYKNAHNNYYLVLHSGDDGYRNDQYGIYPSLRVWYRDKIKTITNESGHRYLKYLVDDAAEKFIQIALERRHFVADFHRELTNCILNNSGSILCSNTYQHYGMDTDHTALLGTGLIKLNERFPIFSNEGLPIVIVRPSKKMWSVQIDNDQRFVIPHGWGQCIQGVTELNYNASNNKLSIICDSKTIESETIGYSVKIPKRIASVRQLKYYTEFLNGKKSYEACWNNNLFVEIEDILFPLASYNAENGEIKKWT